MTVNIGLSRVGSKFFSLVVGWVGLGRVTQNGPMDNSDSTAVSFSGIYFSLRQAHINVVVYVFFHKLACIRLSSHRK